VLAGTSLDVDNLEIHENNFPGLAGVQIVNNGPLQLRSLGNLFLQGDPGVANVAVRNSSGQAVSIVTSGALLVTDEVRVQGAVTLQSTASTVTLNDSVHTGFFAGPGTSITILAA